MSTIIFSSVIQASTTRNLMNFHDTLIKLFPQFGNSIFQLNDVHIVLLVVEYLAGDTLGEFPIEVSTNDSFDKNVIGTNNFTPPYAPINNLCLVNEGHCQKFESRKPTTVDLLLFAGYTFSWISCLEVNQDLNNQRGTHLLKGLYISIYKPTIFFYPIPGKMVSAKINESTLER